MQVSLGWIGRGKGKLQRHGWDHFSHLYRLVRIQALKGDWTCLLTILGQVGSKRRVSGVEEKVERKLRSSEALSEEGVM